jgi:type I restriction enzyme M protein
MNYQEIKQKIKNCRNILVGIVPSPEAQVQQITIALMYKFMDDMDKEAQEKHNAPPMFFAGEFSKYSWTKLLSPQIGNQEKLNLYAEAIEKMNENKGIPQLFRDIFKGAFLPYRNPESLGLFLKEINGFTYDNSENLGNAFEHLLSIMGSQGDAGMFRTPRHIIDFIVGAVDPQKNENICDPACGSAGFLISAYKHIINANTKNKPGDLLSPEEKKKIIKNFVGYDISPDMVRLSKVNMYFHGFLDPTIFEYDTLSSEEKWEESFDVILANPPFMSPKGGIRPHKRFSVQANRSEVLFVDYIIEHLRPKGRAGIIVPEGIIFQSAGAYKQLRKMLVEDGLMAVVSLPAGVFNPYAGVKTSILLFDNEVAKKTKNILFLKIQNDGYDLGAQRREHSKNDLPLALGVIKRYKSALKDGKDFKLDKNEKQIADVIAKEIIAGNGDFNLTGERYKKEVEQVSQKWQSVKVNEIIDLNFGTRITKKNDFGSKYPVYGGGGESFRTDEYNRENEMIISRFAMSENCVRFVAGKFFMLDSGFTYSIKPEKQREVLKGYIDRYFLSKQSVIYSCSRGNAQKNLDIDRFKNLAIPLPPIGIQKEIVEQIEVKQNAINSAKAVIENLEKERLYFGQALRKLEGVEWVELGGIIQTITPPKKIQKRNFGTTGKYPIIDQSQDEIAGWTDDDSALLKFAKPVIVFGDHTLAVKYLEKPFVQGADGIKILETNAKLLPKFLYFLLRNQSIKSDGCSRHFSKLKRHKIPLPSLEIQKQLVAEAEKEQQIINANEQLIEIYEKKIGDVLRNI